MDGTDSLVLSDNASSRYVYRQEGAECSKVRDQTRVRTVLAPNVPRKIHASLGGPVMRRSDAVHHIVHCMPGAVFSANQRSTIFLFLHFPARSLQTANPSAGAMHAPNVLALSNRTHTDT